MTYVGRRVFTQLVSQEGFLEEGSGDELHPPESLA